MTKLCSKCNGRGFYFTRTPGPGNNRTYKKWKCSCKKDKKDGKNK